MMDTYAADLTIQPVFEEDWYLGDFAESVRIALNGLLDAGKSNDAGVSEVAILDGLGETLSGVQSLLSEVRASDRRHCATVLDHLQRSLDNFETQLLRCLRCNGSQPEVLGAGRALDLMRTLANLQAKLNVVSASDDVHLNRIALGLNRYAKQTQAIAALEEAVGGSMRATSA